MYVIVSMSLVYDIYFICSLLNRLLLIVNLCLTIRITVDEIKNEIFCLSNLSSRPAAYYSPNDSQNKQIKTSCVDVLVFNGKPHDAQMKSNTKFVAKYSNTFVWS